MIGGWSILNILMVGQSANSFGLLTNCYFCTAAALQNTNCSTLVASRETMQQDTGSAADFIALFPSTVAIQHKKFNSLQDVINLLLTQLPTHSAVALGYERVNGTGHMIVVFKAQSLVNNDGSVSTPAWGNLRHIDYQNQNPRPGDGILPNGEYENQIIRYHVFHL
jgi:hypothetical protein